MIARVACMALVASAALAGCGEKSQDLATGAKADGAAYKGTGVASFTAPNWTPGNATSWAQELRARGQYGMNEYSRSPSK